MKKTDLYPAYTGQFDVKKDGHFKYCIEIYAIIDIGVNQINLKILQISIQYSIPIFSMLQKSHWICLCFTIIVNCCTYYLVCLIEPSIDYYRLSFIVVYFLRAFVCRSFYLCKNSICLVYMVKQISFERMVREFSCFVFVLQVMSSTVVVMLMQFSLNETLHNY